LAGHVTLPTISIYTPDWYDGLSPDATLLAMMLERTTELTHAGVVAWNPEHVAGWTRGWTADTVRAAVDELAARDMVVLDADTGELWLVDRIEKGGAVRSPKLRPAVARAISAILSGRLRALAVAVLRRLVALNPAGWAHPAVAELVGNVVPGSGSGSVSVAAEPVVSQAVDTLSEVGVDRVSDTVSDPGLPAVSRSPLKVLKEKTKGIFRTGDDGGDSGARVRVPIAADYRPSAALVSWALRECPGVDVGQATRAFVNYNISHGNRWADPDAAWRGWMSTAAARGSYPVRVGRAVRPREAPAAPVTPVPPPVADRLAALTPAGQAASAATRDRLRTSWRGLAGSGLAASPA
jgi:hypothetical protein